MSFVFFHHLCYRISMNKTKTIDLFIRTSREPARVDRSVGIHYTKHVVACFLLLAPNITQAVCPTYEELSVYTFSHPAQAPPTLPRFVRQLSYCWLHLRVTRMKQSKLYRDGVCVHTSFNLIQYLLAPFMSITFSICTYFTESCKLLHININVLTMTGSLTLSN